MGGAVGRALAITALALTFPSTAAAADFDQLFGEYRAAGSIEGCEHTTADLSDVLAAVPADIKAYDPGFVDALNAALEGRAAGCGGGRGGALSASVEVAVAKTAADGSPGPRTPRRLATTLADAQAPSDLDAIIVALGVGASAVAIGAAFGWRRRDPT